MFPDWIVVAKVSVTIKPSTVSLLEHFSEEARDVSQPLASTLRYESPQLGFQFLHDDVWYVTFEQSDRVLLGSTQNGNQTAHCNVTTLPARSAGHETTLEEFERDVRESLDDNLETVSASTQWTTPPGPQLSRDRCSGHSRRGADRVALLSGGLARPCHVFH